MDEKQLEQSINNTSRQVTEVLVNAAPDTGVISRGELKKPVNNVEWKTLVGTESTPGYGKCYSKDPEANSILQEKGVDYIYYDHKGNPHFETVEAAHCKVSDMQGGENARSRNYSMADEKLLGTQWAKEHNLHTKADIKAYREANKLTWHEEPDGVTMRLVPRKINETFKHTGGVATMKAAEKPVTGIKDTGRVIAKTGIKARQAGVRTVETIEGGISGTSAYLSEQTNRFLDSESAKINSKGIDGATHAAAFAATLSVTKNLLEVAKGQEELSEAAKNVLVDTASAAVVGYASGALMESLSIGGSEAALLVNGTVQISKQLIAYAKGDLTEAELATNCAETVAILASAYAGKMVGSAVGGAIAGPLGAAVGGYIGEMITTAVCSEVISTIKFNKEFDKEIHRITSLYRNAEVEIRRSQARLEAIIEQENDELRNLFIKGMNEISNGIMNNSPEQFEAGLLTIGSKFGVSAEYLKADEVTLDNLFLNSDEIIVLS